MNPDHQVQVSRRTDSRASPPRVAVVGAGYAGLACAVELADAGMGVDVFEASRTLGGRARAVTTAHASLDNGVHILVGAYRETLRLMKRVGADLSLQRHPLHLEYPDGIRLHAPPLPAPLHLLWALLTARGLSGREKLAALRFMRALERCKFRLPRDITARQLLANQPLVLRRFLWEPLCLATLNTPVAQASAQVFLHVLRDTLAAGRADADLLLPTTDFSNLFPEPAAVFIAAHGGTVRRGTRVRQLRVEAGMWWIDEAGPYSQVVLAVAPYHLPPLLAPHPALAPLVKQVGAFAWQPIATVYLQYPATIRLPFPMLGMSGSYGQWLFDQGALRNQPGLLAVVISGAGAWQLLGHDDLAAALHREITARVPAAAAVFPEWTRVIEEKRATFCCTPGIERPAMTTPIPGLFLAGDHVASPYPATLEAAVRSGVAAAGAIRALRR